MNKKLSLRQRLGLAAIVLAVAFIVGDVLWRVKDPAGYKGIGHLFTRYEAHAPLWVEDGRLTEDVLRHYYAYEDAQLFVARDSTIYATASEGRYVAQKYWQCKALLQFDWDNGQFEEVAYVSPWPAFQDCANWAVRQRWTVYRGTITTEDGQKVIRMAKWWGFVPARILLMPYP